MTDFITLLCPSCGGSLSVRPTTVTLRCDHCGSEHIVRREAGAVLLEAFARCPACGRNDRVEKVSAILVSQTHVTEATVSQSEVAIGRQGQKRVVTREVPITQTQVSALAQQLAAPTRPPQRKTPARPRPGAQMLTGGAVMALIGVLALCLGLSLAIEREGGTCALMLSLLLLAGGAALVYFGREKNRVAAARHKELIAQIRDRNQRQETAWKRASERWDRLYYCYRDGCIFVPGKGTFAPLPQMNDYLYGPD